MYEQLKKNNVDAAKQLKESDYVRFINPDGKGIRVMFAGNSMTLHGPKADIGWHGEWGMAASEKEKDYVHILMNRITQKDNDAAFCICQVANWEVSFQKGSDTYNMYTQAKEFEADIIIVRFIENCAANESEGEIFKKELCSFIDYLGSSKSNIILTTGFWKHPHDAQICAIAKERNYPLAVLGDLGELDEMKAIGLFEHSGVAAHPGDKGMLAIADRIWNIFQKL